MKKKNTLTYRVIAVKIEWKAISKTINTGKMH